MSKPPLIFIIVLAIIAVLASRQFIKQRRSRQREVIAGEEMRYEAWFHPLNGAGDIRLTVTAKDYHQMDKGVKGELKVQGSRFISFTPEKP